MSLRSTSRVRVRYAETDQMGVAWHGEFFAWFEVGRTDLLRERGLSYKELEGRDVHLPVVEVAARYLRPARYDDLLEIRTHLRDVSWARVSFDYAVHREGEAEPLCTGMTAHAAVDGRGRPRRLPSELKSLLA